MRASSKASKPHSYGESLSAPGRFGPSSDPIASRASARIVETPRNIRIGRYSERLIVRLETSARADPETNSALVARYGYFSVLVPEGGLEPPRLSALPPQGSASTNSATRARFVSRRILPFLVRLRCVVVDRRR